MFSKELNIVQVADIIKTNLQQFRRFLNCLGNLNIEFVAFQVEQRYENGEEKDKRAFLNKKANINWKPWRE